MYVVVYLESGNIEKQVQEFEEAKEWLLENDYWKEFWTISGRLK